VENGRSLIINIGTTTEEVSKALLRHRGIRVVTNNLNVASILSGCDDAQVIVAGGLVRKRDRGIVGEATIDFMRQFKVDIGVIGVSGTEADGTFLDYDYREVGVIPAIMERSPSVAGSRPLQVREGCSRRLGSLSQMDKFLADLPVPAEAAEALEKAGGDGDCGGSEIATPGTPRSAAVASWTYLPPPRDIGALVC
jgi:DeoR family glycerol-3-phosphate regulon repressor